MCWMRTRLLLMVLMMAMAGGGARADLSGVQHFTYWLANPSPALISASGFDMAVVDYSRDGSGAQAFRRDDVALMQRKPDGERRIVLSYLSVGEAEDYRFYWKPEWSVKAPSWLEAENPDWEGNFKVRYWDPDWKRIIFGSPDAYLDRIIAAGFDGAEGAGSGSSAGVAAIGGLDGPRTAPTRITELFGDDDEADPLADDDDDFDVPSFLK